MGEIPPPPLLLLAAATSAASAAAEVVEPVENRMPSSSTGDDAVSGVPANGPAPLAMSVVG